MTEPLVVRMRRAINSGLPAGVPELLEEAVRLITHLTAEADKWEQVARSTGAVPSGSSDWKDDT